MALTLGQAGADVNLNLLGRTLPAMVDHRTQPGGKIGTGRAQATHAAQIEMGVGVDQAGKKGDIAKVVIGSAFATRFDGHDGFVLNRDRAPFQRRPIGREKPTSR